MSVDFPPNLLTGLWHSTQPDRWELIQSTGAIIAEPDLPDSERWKTARGSDYFPYVRRLGGVSLFNFQGFDPEAYSQRCPNSSWREFVPFSRRRGESIWLRVDITRVVGHYICPETLWEKQDSDKAWRHTLMPEIEAAVVGYIPLRAITVGYLSTREQVEFQRVYSIDDNLKT